MTGFGRNEKKTKLGLISVEVSSVNNRFLEFSIRMPRTLYSLETSVRQLVGERVNRGKFSILINMEPTDDAAAKYPINAAAAKAYYRQLERIRTQLKIGHEVTLNDLVVLPDLASPEKDDLSSEEAWKLIEPVVDRALSELIAMRKKEGAALARDMRKRLKSMADHIKEIEKVAPRHVREYRDKLRARVDELLDAPRRDTLRLEEEVAYLAERTDITEECIRLKSHIKQYRETLGRDEPNGKRLNFILQEMNREVNTIGSKSADLDISATVITLKEEVEKLREQVQNVE
jgi:uncharacterized protein (TIGR00255 family)